MAAILPGWNSVEAASTWHRGFEIAGFIALGLLLLFEVLAYIYGNRKDALLAIQQSNAAADAEKQQKARDMQAATNVAAANEAARKAQEAQKLADEKATELKEELAPRSLSKDQERKISSYLEPLPKGAVVIKADISTQDARGYADRIAALLRSKGWTVRVDNAMFAGPNTKGLWITIRDPKAVPIGAGILQKAFGAAGISVAGQSDPSGPDATDGFWLCIGFK